MPTSPQRVSPVSLRISEEALDLIADEEGWVPYAYDDADPKPPARKTFITDDNADLVKGTLTIGHGHTRTVKPGMRISHEEGRALLRSDVREAESCVHRYVKVPLTQGEFDGIADLFYNIGPGCLPNQRYPNGKDGIACLGKSRNGEPSTLLSLLNRGDYEAAGRCFTQWRMPGSMFEWGLIKRRVRFMLRFLGLPLARAANGFPNAMPLGAPAIAMFVESSIRKAEEERGDLEALGNPARRGPTTIIVDKLPESPPAPPPLQPPSGTQEALILAKAAAPVSSEREANGGGPGLEAPSPVPLPHLEPGGQVKTGESPEARGPGQGPAPAPSSVPKVEAKPAPKPIVIAPKTVDVNAIPYGQVLPENGAKNMTDSKRFAGMLIVAAGSLVQVLAAREVVSSTAGAVFFDMSRDPVLVALAVGGIFWVIGHLTRKRGQKVITTGMQSATQLLK